MSKSINSIVWPEDPNQAIKEYIKFMLIACAHFKVGFTNTHENPLRLAKSFLLGEISLDVLNDASVFWWDIIDNKGIRNFDDKDILNARIAVCILSLKERSYFELGQHLSWFIEVMGFSGYDETDLIKLYCNFFTFK